MKPHKIIKTTKLKGSEVEIEAELDFEEVKKHRNKAIAKIQKGLELPGFRPGHVPEKMIIEKIGDLAIWEEAAEIALQPSIMDIIEEGKYNFFGQPQTTVMKIAEGNPVEFKIRLVILPEVTLADYNKISKKINGDKETKFEATDKDLEDAILKIRESYAEHFKPEHKHDDTCDHSHDEEKKPELPEVNEEFLKKLGDFKDVEDFKAKVREGIIKEKEHREKEKTRLAIVEKIIADSEIDLPNVLVEAELNKMAAQFSDDITRFGLKVEDYLKHIHKTIEDLRKEWTVDAEKRAKLQLILAKIAQTEKIEPNPEALENEVKAMLTQYKEAVEERVRAYVTMVMTNEKVFEFLEGIK